MSDAGFIEPTRRLPFGRRVDYSGRYGASLVLVLFGSYLLINTSIGQIFGGVALQQPELAFYFVSQIVFAVLVLVLGLLISPATLVRRAVAVIVVVVIVVAWIAISGARISGGLPPLGGLTPAVVIFTTPASVVTFVAAFGWLTVRERPIVSYLLLLPTILGGIIAYAMVLAGISSVISLMASNVLALALGVGIAWGARGLATLFGRRVVPVSAPPLA